MLFSESSNKQRKTSAAATAAATLSPSHPSETIKKRTLLSASLSQDAGGVPTFKPTNSLVEKTVFRSSNFQADDGIISNDRPRSQLAETPTMSCSSSSSSSSVALSARPISVSGSSSVSNRRKPLTRQQQLLQTPTLDVVPDFSTDTTTSTRHRRASSKQSRRGPDWPSLGDKIENWFELARTPDQKVVYGFLNDLKKRDEPETPSQDFEIRNNNNNPSRNEQEQENDSTNNKSNNSNNQLSDRARSLEDILHNLKKYRTKFANTNRCSRCRTSMVNGDEGGRLSRRRSGQQTNEQFTSTTLDREGQRMALESTTWRVMRHLRSADIRSKYPLPKANPDCHFRNSTVFVTAGRPPKATFLLHPDWV